MRRIYAALGWGIIALGIVHMVSTPRVLKPSAVWFFSGGLALAQTGALNLLNRNYGRMAPGLRWLCVGTNAAMTIFTLISGRVTGASVAALVTVVGWMGATTGLSLVNRPPG